MTTAPDDGKPTPRLTIVDRWESLTPTVPGPTQDRAIVLTRTQKVLVGIVAAGVLLIASLGFVGSYAAVTDLATAKGFGKFALAFPVGIDAGIVVFLALDLLLTWLRMPYPTLRQIAWALTAATIAFNAATAWPDPLGVGMHGTIPILFIAAVEAARHAIGVIADIGANKHTETPPLARWLLAPWATFRIWRRQKLWELRSYEDVLTLEREALQYRETLRATYGRRWRKEAGAPALLALRFAKTGTPIATTLARQERELAAVAARQEAANTAAICRQNDRQEQRQEPASTPTPGDNNGRHLATGTPLLAATGADNSTDKKAANNADLSTTTTANTTDKSTDKSTTTSDNSRQKPPVVAAKKTDKKPAKKSDNFPAPRRSAQEWVEVATGIYDDLCADVDGLPSASQFATAIKNAGLGTVSESTAKNVRSYILRAPVTAK